MTTPPLQRNPEQFVEGNQCLLALLGCVSFGQQLKALLPGKASGGQARDASEADATLLHALLGIVAVHQTLERSVSALAAGPVRHQQAANPVHDAEPLDLRGLLR